MTEVKASQDKSTKVKLQKILMIFSQVSIFTPQVSTSILIAGSEKIILHFTTLPVKIDFKNNIGSVPIPNRKKIIV